MIQEEYVSFDTARMLKEAGFDEPCDWAYYNDGKIAAINAINSTLSRGYISRPTQSLAARWIREVHNIHVFANYSFDKKIWFDVIILMECTDPLEATIPDLVNYESSEDAMEFGIQRALKMIKKGNKRKKRP